jgi:hypothetical protein
LKRWIDARRNHRYFVSKNAEFLKQEINLHIKGIAKPNETDYEIPCTSGINGRRNWLKTAAKVANAENQKSFEKLLAFLN